MGEKMGGVSYSAMFPLWAQVKHARYGEGKIVKHTQAPNKDLNIEVVFASGSQKTFRVSFLATAQQGALEIVAGTEKLPEEPIPIDEIQLILTEAERLNDTYNTNSSRLTEAQAQILRHALGRWKAFGDAFFKSAKGMSYKWKLIEVILSAELGHGTDPRTIRDRWQARLDRLAGETELTSEDPEINLFFRAWDIKKHSPALVSAYLTKDEQQRFRELVVSHGKYFTRRMARELAPLLKKLEYAREQATS